MTNETGPDPEQLAILSKGVHAWNQWVLKKLNIEKNLKIEKNFRRADLQGADLPGAYLQQADLQQADLRGADLRVANLPGANLVGADLRGANLVGADLEGANLREAKLQQANLGYARLGGADLRKANLREAELGNAKLVGADLQGAGLVLANLEFTDFADANLSNTFLIGSKMLLASLSNAIVEDAVVADFRPVSLRGYPNPPARLRLDEKGEKVLEGVDAARFFQSLAVVQIVVSEELNKKEELAYQLTLAQIQEELDIGQEVDCSRVFTKDECTIIELEAPTYNAIYEVLPLLLQPFPSSEAIRQDVLTSDLLNSNGQNDSDTGTSIALSSAIAPIRTWVGDFAGRFLGICKAKVIQIVEPIRNRTIDVRGEYTDIEVSDEIVKTVVNNYYITYEGGTTIMGDQTKIKGKGIVAATGDNANAQARDIIIDSAHIDTSGIDAAQFLNELTTLVEALKSEAKDPDQLRDLAAVMEAQEAAKNNDLPAAIGHLKKAGQWTWKVAEKIGIGVAIAAAKSAAGL
jgi:uncharacterized protein YjbI with pentapeptide repeats